MKYATSAAMVLFLTGAFATYHIQAKPVYTTFDCAAGVSTEPMSINDNGVIAGNCGTEGFVRATDGTITIFEVPNAQYTSVTGMNINGDIVGFSRIGNDMYGFLRAPDGTLTTFEGLEFTAINDTDVATGLVQWRSGFVRLPDGTITTFSDEPGQTFPESINNNGVIVGESASDQCCGIIRAFYRLPNGKITNLKLPGDVNEALDINIHKDIVGFDKLGGFILDGHGGIVPFQIRKLALVGAQINDRGEIAGSFESAEVNYACDDGCRSFFRASDGTIRKIKVPGFSNANATAMNNAAWIAGSYQDAGRNLHGFVRTP